MDELKRERTRKQKPGQFRWRGGEVSRLEGFSDAVFAFALTLLVVSLEVPRTFRDLMAMMRNFPAFAVCFFLLMDIWVEHYHYFRRYALHDAFTRTMNTLLLFVVLFYVYPLKFLFSIFIGQFTNSELLKVTPGREPPITNAQMPTLFIIYGLGAAAVFLIFALMFRHAYGLRDELELNELERFDTRASMVRNSVMLSVPLISAACAAFGPASLKMLAGPIYFLYGPVITLERTLEGRKRKAIEKRIRGEMPARE